MKKFLAVIALAVAAACGNPPSHEYEIPTIVDIQGSVTRPDVATNLADAFSQALACPADQLTWSIQEGVGALAGGLITQSGGFTAPSCGSPYIGSSVHVVANGCGRIGTATIAVVEDLSSVVISHAVVNPGAANECSAADPLNPVVTPGSQVQFYADLVFTCRSVTTPTPPATWPAVCP